MVTVSNSNWTGQWIGLSAGNDPVADGPCITYSIWVTSNESFSVELISEDITIAISTNFGFSGYW